MNQTWAIDPATGDYVLDSNGKPVIEDGLNTPAYIRLRVRRGTWLYAPDTEYGSDYHLIQRRTTVRDSTLIEDTGLKALKPFLDDGRATDIITRSVEVTRSTTRLATKIRDAAGQIEDLNLVPIGVR